MKNFILTALLVFFSFQAYSQVSKFSKKELRELARIQQRKIISLELKAEQLVELEKKFQIVEQQKFSCLEEGNRLAKKLAAKEEEMVRKNQERDFLLSSIRDYKKDIEEKNSLLALRVTPVSEYSKPQYTKINAVKSPKEVYKERTFYKPNRRHYITGPRGGCYYIDGNGNKTYVDRSLCN